MNEKKMKVRDGRKLKVNERLREWKRKGKAKCKCVRKEELAKRELISIYLRRQAGIKLF